MLKNQVDLVLCFPDASLYNSATIKPFSTGRLLRYRLPLKLVFPKASPERAPCSGSYPDFYESGTRAAELVQKLLSGQPVPKVENPRKFPAWPSNQNITRLLGLGPIHHPQARAKGSWAIGSGEAAGGAGRRRKLIQ